MQPMAPTNTTHEFMHHLSMALCEWFLMFLMFMDAALGFILTKFAHHCELQSPCMFCLRLDHVFGEKPRSFLSLFCNKHQDEVSDSISCQLHHKLADVREMCDDCFMSIMKQNDNKKPFLNKRFVRVPSSNGTCSCCKIEWKPRPRSAVKLGVSKVTMKPTMPRVGGRGRGRFRRRNDFKRVRDRISGNSTPCHLENNIFMDVDVDMDTDALSDSGCADLRFYSGTDSDDSFYEVDCGEDGCYNDDLHIINDKGILNQDHVRTEQSCSVSNSEPSLQNGHHNRIITGPESLKSDGSIGVKENGPLEVSKETRAYNQDFHSFKDHKAIDVIENGPLEVSKETRDYNQDFHSFKDHKAIGVKENGPLEVSKETRDYNQDFHSFKDHKASPSSDKHEGYDSPGSSGVSEIEGESDLEKLKRQVEHYQERLRLLHKELEEERNAAAIAADEAMAMITRLQEEKAALHMEASQYLRMMDEQAEYDMEAVDKANDLVAEKDKEIQDLEAELEYFRNRYEDELFKGDGPYVEGNKFKENPVENGKTDVNSSFILGLEEEKKYILQSLSELKRKFDQFSNGNVAENGLSIHDEVDVGTLENDILDLNKRLETLEADQDFLEHACSTLQSKGGLEFVQEIAHHLHDLRRVRFDRRCQAVA